MDLIILKANAVAKLRKNKVRISFLLMKSTIFIIYSLSLRHEKYKT